MQRSNPFKPAATFVAVAILSVLAPDARAQECGDVDNNGGIFASDALRLLQKAVGTDVTLICPADGGGGAFDATDILADLAEDVYFLTYANLADKAAALASAAAVLAADPNVTALEAAQQAWRDTRRPWESSEGFLFGPVDEQALDPALDTWPVNKVDFDNILNSGSDLTDPAVIDSLDDAVKGFHTIEFLLFDDGTGTAGTNFIGNRDSASIVAVLEANTRRLDYLTGTSANLLVSAQTLSDAWDPAVDNFAAEFSGAGKTSSRWVSQKAALQEAIEALAGIADEVANGKIADPFNQQDTKLEESQFSYNSLTDFTNNITSIRNVYLGSNPQGCSVTGLTAYVKTVNAALDTQVRTEIDAAIAAIGAIAEPFHDSITNSAQAANISAAIAAINDLRATIESALFDQVVNDGEFAF